MADSNLGKKIEGALQAAGKPVSTSEAWAEYEILYPDGTVGHGVRMFPKKDDLFYFLQGVEFGRCGAYYKLTRTSHRQWIVPDLPWEKDEEDN